MSASEYGRLPEILSQSQILRDYESAFTEATGLPMKFETPGKRRPGMRGSANANAFCTKMSEMEAGCRMCADMQTRLATESEGGATISVACLAGLTDSTVPVRAGGRVLGYLQTGQVALKKLKQDDFRRVMEWLQRGGEETDFEKLKKAYFGTRVIDRSQYEAVLRLLGVFAQHLSIAAEQIATQQANAQPPQVERARRIIEQRSGEELSLSEVAGAVNASTFHFCKMFKRATGMTFTEYLAMVRVAKAKNLLANPQARISEIAFEAGFSSITHFNRVFRRLAGQSPTEFRRSIRKN